MKEIKEYKEALATFLIGPPASGKSTWREKNQRKEDVIISRDDIVDSLRKGTGMSYADTFKDSSFQSKVNSALEKLISDTIRSQKSFIVDMTNMTKGGRAKILNRLPHIYLTKAVIFNVSRSELSRRLKKREEETGKRVGEDIVDNMIKSYQEPTKEEFDIIHKN